MDEAEAFMKSMDHCRIGSLENFIPEASMLVSDHCRIGSLETLNQ